VSAQKTKDNSHQFDRYTKEELTEVDAKNLLREFARFRSFVVLPFNFLQNARIIEKNTINCHRWLFIKWQINQRSMVYNMKAALERRSGGDYANRLREVPDIPVQTTKTYIVPGSQREEECSKCRGAGKYRCKNCGGTGQKRCLICGGTGKEEHLDPCWKCDGEGKLTEHLTRTRKISGAPAYEEEWEVKGPCDECKGTGFIIRYGKCTRCGGKGRRKCDICHGSGLLTCEPCKGSGKIQQVTVTEIIWTPCDRNEKIYSPEHIPDKYFNSEETNGEWVRAEVKPIPSDMIQETKIEKIKIKEVIYNLGDKTYTLYEVGGKLRFESYPRSFKKLLTFILTPVILILIVLFAMNINGLPLVLSKFEMPTFKEVDLSPIANFNSGINNLPTGKQVFEGVPFLIAKDKLFLTQYGVATFPTEVILRIDIPHPQKLTILVNTTNTYRQFSDQQVGKISLVFDNDTDEETILIAGINVREYTMDTLYGDTVRTVTDPASQVAWQGQSLDGRSIVIDMLTIPIGPNNQSRSLKQIIITDTSDMTTHSSDPGLIIWGLTISYVE
jgi:hypothetical protein